jgi:hypothetical protein
MPMIGVYAAQGTFEEKHEDLTAAARAQIAAKSDTVASS